MCEKNYIAIDLGASGGRVMLGRWDGHAITLDELHRFSNDAVRVNGTLYWDILRLLHEIKTGLAKASQHEITAIGIDTWGVDFGLLDRRGLLLENPIHYRDSRTNGVIEEVDKLLTPRALYDETGLQRLPFNTIYQLYALKSQRPEVLDQAKSLLMLPDLLGYFLTGAMATESSIARTTQLLNVHTGDWSSLIFDKLGLPRELFGEIVPSGTVLGTLLPEIQDETGLGPVPVISVCGHDTGSAVCAVPAAQDDFAKANLYGSEFAFISSGTWSLFGTELDRPIVNDKSFSYSITNESGFGKTRFLKNITGLWLIQESRRHWNRHSYSYSYADLERLALEAPPFARFIDPDDPAFIAHGNVPERISAYCTKTGQTPPGSVGETVRCIYESLAMKYRATLEKLELCTGKRYNALHVMGGGVKDGLLCKMTARACGIPVLAGPAEATVLGNLLAQMIAQGEVADLRQAREVVRGSFDLDVYGVDDGEAWREAYWRFKKVKF
ncbi:MAG: rhamnulokinase [Oscillospiraceae bacterium]|nr:rhamnulokinase [Oscillospiraceae bacterium]